MSLLQEVGQHARTDGGSTHVLTPVGNKLECCVCGNVYWANDPTGAKSENPLAPPPLTEQERWTRFRQSDGSREERIAAVRNASPP